MGSLQIRHRKGPERLYGKTGDGGWPMQPADVGPGEGGKCKGTKVCGRSDVSPRAAPPGAPQARAGRRNWRCVADARLSNAWAGCLGILDALAGKTERTALADLALPQLHLGQRRLLQR